MSSLWDWVHDADLKKFKHDGLSQTVTLIMTPGFPKPPVNCPKTIIIEFRSVRKLLVFVSEKWSGEMPAHPKGITREEWRHLLDGYANKALTTTISPIELGRVCHGPYSDVYDARWSASSRGVLFELDGLSNKEQSYRLVIESSDLNIQTNLGPRTMTELVQLGRSAWDRWENR